MGKARIAVANRFNKSIDDFRLNAVSEVPRRCNIGKAPPSVRDFFVLCERIQYQREEADILLKDFGEGLGGGCPFLRICVAQKIERGLERQNFPVDLEP